MEKREKGRMGREKRDEGGGKKSWIIFQNIKFLFLFQKLEEVISLIFCVYFFGFCLKKN